MYYIGIDLGTSAVKLLLMEESGKICNIVSREYPLFFPHPGWSEQKPEDWFAQSMEGMKELTKDIDRAQVAGIGFGGQMHGLVTLDKDDNVIRPAILWNDGRTGEETEYLNTVIGKDKLSQYTANIAFAGFTAPKILWMQKNEPENFKKVVKIMLPKDYLAYRLSGSFCTDVSDASGMLLLDVKNRCWSKEMLEICGITEEQLPKLYESWEVVGTLKPEIAKELGFSENVKVVAGAGDNAAAAVGTGTVGDGQCNISLGTSGTVFISSKNFGVDENNALHSFCHADGSYHLMGCMLSAASCNKWWAEEILQTKDFAAEQAPIQKLGENHVFFLPYLMGERSPHNNPDARGVFFGMSMDSTRADMTPVSYTHLDVYKRQWKKRVTENDTVVITGDHSWGRDLAECQADLDFIMALPGRKILLRGNHDMFWDAKKTENLNEMFRGKLEFLQNNFYTYEDYALVGTKGYCYEGKDSYEHFLKIRERELGRLRCSFEAAKAAGYEKFIMFLHYPPTSIGEMESPFTLMAQEFGAEKVIYSHCHGEKRYDDSFKGYVDGIEYKLVSGDYLNFKPELVLR